MKSKSFEPLFKRIANILSEEQPFSLDFEAARKGVKDDVKKIKEGLLDAIVKLKKEKQFCRYVNHYQNTIIRQCNKVIESLPVKQLDKLSNSDGEDSILNLYSFLYSELIGLLDYFETTFPNYFNLDTNIPKCKKTMSQLEFITMIKSVAGHIKCELKDIALVPIREFVETNPACSYRNFYYLSGLKNEIEKHCCACNDIKEDCGLRDSLIYHNFNCNSFYCHQTRAFTGLYSGKNTRARQKETLNYYFKKVSQLPINGNIAFDYDHVPIKEQLLSWFREEIKYHEEKEITAPGYAQRETSVTLAKNKVATNLSVPLFSYLISLSYRKGIYSDEEKEVILFFANNLKTKYTDNISLDSFTNKYKKPEGSTINAMIQLLIELLNLAKKDQMGLS